MINWFQILLSNSTCAATARFNFPRGLALSKDAATLYVADGDNHRVRSVDTATGAVETLAGTGGIGKADGQRSVGALYYPSAGPHLHDNQSS
jgi:sugar lactone lactonase YvrE